MIPTLLATEGIIYAYENSNLAGKVILFGLLVASIFSWSIMLIKFMLLRDAYQANKLFLLKFRASRSPLDIYSKQLDYVPSPMFAIYLAGAKECCFHMLGSEEVDATFTARLATSEKLDTSGMAAVRSAMDRAVGEQMLKFEDRLNILATVVSGSPFLGLLGTVWGVMDAFSGVAEAKSASIAALAPGVSGALITTVIALVVAIPAMFGYNFIISTVRGLTVQMENFAMECAADIEHHYFNKP